MAGGKDDANDAAPRPRRAPRKAKAGTRAYVLDEQVGFVLRQVGQRHAAIFASRMGESTGEDLTTTQWAALAKLAEVGPSSQNLLGRLTAMDAATVKGVVDRLVRRGLLETRPDPEDGRRLLVALSEDGAALTVRFTPIAFAISDETLAPLEAEERATFLSLLNRLK